MINGDRPCTWKSATVRLLTLVCALGVLAANQSSALAEKWIGLVSPHFTGISNADEKKSRRLLDKLERFRAGVLQIFSFDDSHLPPVRVVFFRNDRSLDPFKPRVDGKTTPAAGFFQGRDDYAVIVVNAGTGDWAALDSLKAAERRKSEAGLTLKLDGPRPRSVPGWTSHTDVGSGCSPSVEKPDRAVVSRGRLLRLECGENRVYVVDVEGEEVKFVAAAGKTPPVSACGFELDRIACGDLDFQATVYLAPELEMDSATGAIRALAIELGTP